MGQESFEKETLRETFRGLEREREIREMAQPSVITSPLFHLIHSKIRSKTSRPKQAFGFCRMVASRPPPFPNQVEFASFFPTQLTLDVFSSGLF